MSVFKDDKKFNLADAYHQSFGKIADKVADSVEEIYEEIPYVRKRKKRRASYRIIKYASNFVLMVFIVSVIGLAVYGFIFRSVYADLLNGRANLENAVYFAKAKNFEEASSYAKKASSDFAAALANYEVSRNTFLAKSIPGINKQFLNGYYLLSSAQLVSDSMYLSLEYLNKIYNLLGVENVSYSDLTPELKREVLEYIYKSGSELSELKMKLDLAQSNIEQVEFPYFLGFINSRITQLSDQIAQAKEFVDMAVPGSKLIPELLGYPQKRAYLFLLQNKDELRPTGGFIGTYGIVESDSGDLTRFETHDIYHLDMPVKDKLQIKPPAPLEKYLGIPFWYLRDSNWSPDFPTAAKQAVWFYLQENQLLAEPDPIDSFNGVIAITPEFITDLLEITGPVVIEGQEYNKDNFTEILEYRVEKGYVQLGLPSWERKEVIGAISKELKARLLDLDASNWPAIFKVLNENIQEKNILVYFFDPELYNLAEYQGITGEVKETALDYVMAVDSNMAAYKTDSVMNKAIDYTVQKREDGVYALLELNYAHQGSFDYRTTRYRTYTRIYVPFGSELMQAEGYSEGEPVAAEELGKTVFEVFMNVEPGKIGKLTFLYKLPDRIRESIENGRYSLYFQKQPGNDTDELNVDLQMETPVKSYSPVGFNAEKPAANQIKWHTDLSADRQFTVYLQDK